MKIACPYCTKEITPETTQCPSCGTAYGSNTQQLLKKMLKEAMQDQSSERRIFDRVPQKFKITYPTPEALRAHYLSNISPQGVFIEAKNPLTRGARFGLEIVLPDGEKELEVLCEVVWSHKEEQIISEQKYSPGMGIKFLNLSPEGAERIDKLLRTQPK
ncbi:MAG: PilZ domain-containing protein [Pseudomonadota bacterium]